MGLHTVFLHKAGSKNNSQEANKKQEIKQEKQSFPPFSLLAAHPSSTSSVHNSAKEGCGNRDRDAMSLWVNNPIPPQSLVIAGGPMPTNLQVTKYLVQHLVGTLLSTSSCSFRPKTQKSLLSEREQKISTSCR